MSDLYEEEEGNNIPDQWNINATPSIVLIVTIIAFVATVLELALLLSPPGRPLGLVSDDVVVGKTTLGLFGGGRVSMEVTVEGDRNEVDCDTRVEVALVLVRVDTPGIVRVGRVTPAHTPLYASGEVCLSYQTIESEKIGDELSMRLWEA